MSDSIMTDHDMDHTMNMVYELPHRITPEAMEGFRTGDTYRVQNTSYRAKRGRLRLNLPDHPITSLQGLTATHMRSDSDPMAAEEARIVAKHNERMLFLEQFNLKPIIIRKRVFDDEKLNPIPGDIRRRELSDAEDMDIDREASSPSVTPPLPSSPQMDVGGAASITEQPPDLVPMAEVEQDIRPERMIWRGQWMPCHKVAHICRKVQRGFRRTVTTTVQAAVEVVGSVKRRAFGIENRQQSPRRIARDSRTRLLQRREEMLVGASPERRRRLRDQWKLEDRGFPSPTRSVPSSPLLTPTGSSFSLTLMNDAQPVTSSTQPQSDDIAMVLDDPTVPDHILQPTPDVTLMALDDPTVLDNVLDTAPDVAPMALDPTPAPSQALHASHGAPFGPRSHSRSSSPSPNRQELSGNTGVMTGSPKKKSPTKSKGILKHTQDGRIEKQKNHKSPPRPGFNAESRPPVRRNLPWFRYPEVPRMSLEELLQPVLEEYAVLNPYGRYMTPSTQLQTELTSHAYRSILESPNPATRLCLYRDYRPSSSTAEHIETAAQRQPDHSAYHHTSDVTSHAQVDAADSTYVNSGSVRLDQSSASSLGSYLAPTPTYMVDQSASDTSAAHPPTPSAAHISGSHLAPTPAPEAGYHLTPTSAHVVAESTSHATSAAASLSTGSHLAPTPTHFVDGSAFHPVSASQSTHDENMPPASHDILRSPSATSRPIVDASTSSRDVVSSPTTTPEQALESDFDYPMRPELAPWLMRPHPSSPQALRSENEVEALEQQLSAATVVDEHHEPLQREQQDPRHRPLSVHWLESSTPLGRPVSSVRLFNPESPAVPGVHQRSRAIYYAQWESEQRRATRARTQDQRPRRVRVARGQAVRPLSQQWEARVADAMSAPPNRQLATTLNGDPLTRRDLTSCHTPMAWLNDEVINAYMAMVVDYLRHASGNAGRLDQPKYHAFNSFFYSNLRDKGYDSVRRWASRAKIGGEALLEVDTVFIPVHQNSHWTLLVVRPASRTIEYFDSLGSRSQAFATNVKRWLRGELRDLYKDEEWSVLPTASPQQDNGSDCGVFLLTTAKAVAVGLEPSVYGPSDITTLRKKIVAELMNGGLEGDFDPAGGSSESRL